VDVRQTVLHVRAAKGMLVHQHRSAGSFFKNPDTTEAHLPDGAPFWASEHTLKVSAAWLVEHSGYAKGHTRGNAAISPHHVLALVNHAAGEATACEIAMLAREIQERVIDRFGILLEPEVRLVGFDPYPLL
jgi:UDP-N-acetylmuramate dehydrogenase